MCSLRVTESKQSTETSHNGILQNPEQWVGSGPTEGKRDSFFGVYSLSSLDRGPFTPMDYPGPEDTNILRQFALTFDISEAQHASGSHERLTEKVKNSSFSAIRAIAPSATATFYQTPIASSSKQIADAYVHAGLRQRPSEIEMPHALRALKPHSTPATMQWLKENYQQADGVCIPRHVIYNHYCRFCHRNSMSPVNAANFGKIIRQKFNTVKNRRLGTRGRSTYHYHGIGILATSSFYKEQVFNTINGDSTNRVSPSLMIQPSRQDSSSLQLQENVASTSRFRAIWNDRESLTNFSEILLPPQFPSKVANSFIIWYRAHCQRIYESIFGMNIQEVQEFVLHFWSEVPVHFIDVLETNVVINIIGVCDSSLYGSISEALFPNIHKPGHPRLFEMLNKLASNFENWLSDGLLLVPAELRILKLGLARNFCRGLGRLTSLNKLCNSGPLVGNPGIMEQMLIDFRGIDVSLICSDVVYNKNKMKAAEDTQLIINLFSEFERLIELQVSLQHHLSWLDAVIDRYVKQIASERSIPSIQVARNFLLVWVGIVTRILRDLTLTSATSFGSYHLLGLVYHDYLTHCTELLVANAQAEQMKKHIALSNPTAMQREFIQEQRAESIIQQPRFQPISQFHELHRFKIATSKNNEQHVPIQGFLCKQETPADIVDSSEIKQEFEDIDPLLNLHNQLFSNNMLLAPNSGLFNEETNFNGEASMYTNSSISPNYQSLQMFATSLQGN